MKELDGHDIPTFSPTVDGECASDPSAAADAKNRGWWTCGGWTSGNDIVACPDKLTWGVSFDDGPAPYCKSYSSSRVDFELNPCRSSVSCRCTPLLWIGCLMLSL